MQFAHCYRGDKKGEKPFEFTWSAEEYLKEDSALRRAKGE